MKQSWGGGNEGMAESEEEHCSSKTNCVVRHSGLLVYKYMYIMCVCVCANLDEKRRGTGPKRHDCPNGVNAPPNCEKSRSYAPPTNTDMAFPMWANRQ